jgi:hypothetical protein
MKISKRSQNGIEILNIESRHLVIALVPALGGKILSVLNKPLQKEFLWTNKNLSLNKHDSGADYDSNFLGGIDELIPNDIRKTLIPLIILITESYGLLLCRMS